MRRDIRWNSYATSLCMLFFCSFFNSFHSMTITPLIYRGWDFWKIIGRCSTFSCKNRGNPCRVLSTDVWLALLFISNVWIFSNNTLYSAQQFFHSNVSFSFNSLWITENVIISSQISAWRCLQRCNKKNQKHVTLFCCLLNMKKQHSVVSLFLFILYFIGTIRQKNVKTGGSVKRYKPRGEVGHIGGWL